MNPLDSPKLQAQVLGAFFGESVRAEKLPAGDPLRVNGQKMSDAFTNGVAFLLTSFPNNHIQSLMKLVWDVVGHRIAPVALGPQVPSLSLAARLDGDAIIFMPHNWLEMIAKDPVEQMGALVFVGSQAVDFYNGRLLTSKETAQEDHTNTIKRARAYEAEYLKTVKGGFPDWKFTPYQQKVLGEYPEGISTPTVASLLYLWKPFVAPQ